MKDEFVVDVVRWEPVAETWLGHRPEPLIHERVGACPLMLEEDARAVRWAGIDAQGRVTALRDSYPDSPPGEPDYVERVEYQANAIVVSHADTVLVRTELDEEGRPLRSVYPSRGLEERYRYDGDGRLTEITGAMPAVGAGGADHGRGTLLVEHDARGPVAIRAESYTVWERIDEPWPELLARGAREIAAGLTDSIEAHVPQPEIEVFALSLTYVDESLHSVVSLGREEDRRRWMGEDLPEEELALRLWYLIDDGLGFIEDYAIPSDLEDLLLREATLKQPANPCRTVLNEVAALLARHDWSGVLKPMRDFVVFIAEHDEAYAPKAESVRAVNPADRLAQWEANWPPGARRGDDEYG